MGDEIYHLKAFDAVTTRTIKRQYYDENGKIAFEASFVADKGRTYLMLYLGDLPTTQKLTLEEIDSRMKANGWVFIGERDVHTEHCCVMHGCKYSDKNCSVRTRKKIQSDNCCECQELATIASGSTRFRSGGGKN